MSRKKELQHSPATRAAPSGYSRPDTPGRGPWLIDWTPADSGSVPSVDLTRRKATLWNPAATWVEAHEGWHIAYTPHRGAGEWAAEIATATGAEVTVDDVRAVEDGRINRLGLDALETVSPAEHARVYAGLGTLVDPAAIKKHVTALLKMGNEREAARLLVAGLPHTRPLLSYRAWRGDTRDMVKALWREVHYAGLTVEGVARVCEHIAGLPSRAKPPPPPPPPPPPDGGIFDGTPHTVIAPPPPPADDGSGPPPWGTMKIITPVLTESIYDGTDALTRPTAEPGTLPKFLHNWRPWEGRYDIFARKRRDSGPRARMSLLIDCSGSMSWSDEELVAVQERMPAATIAVYGGSGRRGTGALVVVAAKGKRMVFDRAQLAAMGVGGANVVDGPALRWLGRQTGPRVWLCDGHVTGVGDRPDYRCTRDARRITEACGIERVHGTGRLFDWLDSHGFKKSAIKRLR